jgi:hypothetical protein
MRCCSSRVFTSELGIDDERSGLSGKAGEWRARLDWRGRGGRGKRWAMRGFGADERSGLARGRVPKVKIAFFVYPLTGPFIRDFGGAA